MAGNIGFLRWSGGLQLFRRGGKRYQYEEPDFERDFLLLVINIIELIMDSFLALSPVVQALIATLFTWAITA